MQNPSFRGDVGKWKLGGKFGHFSNASHFEFEF